MPDIKTIAVIGAGQMGGGIAQIAATAGFTTKLFDPFPGAIDKARALHEKLLARAVEKGRMSQEDADTAKGRITYLDDSDGGGGGLKNLADADIAIEAIIEDADIKKELFANLAEILNADQILATNTSSISITEIASATPCPERVVGMHFFNPVPVMKLVEVINGLATSPDTTQRTIALAENLGKTPVPANDRAGFVSNRVLMPMINEAFYAWMEGVAEPAHIDEIMKLGCAHPMGPLRLADFIGLDTCCHIMDVLADGLNNERYRACPLLKQLVTAGRLGDKAGRGVFDYSK